MDKIFQGSLEDAVPFQRDAGSFTRVQVSSIHANRSANGMANSLAKQGVDQPNNSCASVG